MSSLLEPIKSLLRGCEDMPDNMSATEVNHYAAQVLKRLQRGDDVQTLKQYLRRINTSSFGQFHIPPATHELAERIVLLARKSG